MHDVPAHLSSGINLFHGSIDQPIHFLLAVKPEIFPGKNLRILEEQTPQSYKAAIAGKRLCGDLNDPAVQLNISSSGAFNVDSQLMPLPEAVLAKATDRPAGTGAEVGFQGHIKGALTFRLPHHAVQVIVREPVLHQRRKETSSIGVVETSTAANFSVQVHLCNFFKIGHQSRIVCLFKQTIHLHTSCFGLGSHVRQDVEVPQFGSSHVLNDGVSVKLRMDLGIASSMNLVVGLHTMVWQRQSGNLSTGESPPICEYSGHEHVNGGFLLQRVETLIDPLIHK